MIGTGELKTPGAPGEYQGRLGLQQRVLPGYRAPFFDHLALACQGGLGVYAGAARPSEAIRQAGALEHAVVHEGRNLHVLRSAFYLCWQLDLMAWLQDWDPDALIMEANPRYLSSRTAINWMHARGRPVLGWGLGPGAQASGLRGWFRREFISRFDVLIAYSERGANEYSALGFPAGRIIVAANAVSPPPAKLSDRGSFLGRPLRVIFVGRLQARKRVDLLLEACADLNPLPELMIVGDGPERKRLQQLASNIFPDTRFLGALFGHELDDALSGADLFVLPGTGGLAVQQAMASGLPVIVAQGDGTQEDLVSAGNGWLIPENDRSALAEALRSAQQDPANLLAMGRKSHRLAVQRFNIDTMRDQFMLALALAHGGS